MFCINLVTSYIRYNLQNFIKLDIYIPIAHENSHTIQYINKIFSKQESFRYEQVQW